MGSFCSAKATHIFSAKNIRIFYIESAKTVNEMTLNELVKLTMLWTTGLWFFAHYSVSFRTIKQISMKCNITRFLSCSLVLGWKGQILALSFVHYSIIHTSEWISTKSNFLCLLKCLGCETPQLFLSLAPRALARQSKAMLVKKNAGWLV